MDVKSFFALIIFIFITSFCKSQCEFIDVTIVSNTGNYGNEMSWQVFDVDYNELASFQGVSNFSTSEITLCLPIGCYLLQAYDLWNDGWNGGSLEISYDDQEISYVMPSVAEDYLTIGLYANDCSFEVVGCIDQDAANYNENATEDDGTCIYYTEFVSGNTNRNYIYYAPEDLTPDAPLLFAFHGWTGSALAINEYSGLNELADEHGFAVCYPQGLLDYQGYTHWNSGLTISTVEDVEFITSLAVYLQQEYNLNTECTFNLWLFKWWFYGIPFGL